MRSHVGANRVENRDLELLSSLKRERLRLEIAVVFGLLVLVGVFYSNSLPSSAPFAPSRETFVRVYRSFSESSVELGAKKDGRFAIGLDDDGRGVSTMRVVGAAEPDGFNTAFNLVHHRAPGAGLNVGPVKLFDLVRSVRGDSKGWAHSSFELVYSLGSGLTRLLTVAQDSSRLEVNRFGSSSDFQLSRDTRQPSSPDGVSSVGSAPAATGTQRVELSGENDERWPSLKLVSSTTTISDRPAPDDQYAGIEIGPEDLTMFFIEPSSVGESSKISLRVSIRYPKIGLLYHGAEITCNDNVRPKTTHEGEPILVKRSCFIPFSADQYR